MDLEMMRADCVRWLREGVSVEIANDAINDGIESLWQSLITANVGEYISRKPARLTGNDEFIPFDELSALRFIRYYTISFLFLSVFEFDASAEWMRRAEMARLQAVQEVRQSSRRDETITAYDPFALGDSIPR